MELKKLDQDFSVCKVKDYSLVDLGAEYCFIGKTDEEDSWYAPPAMSRRTLLSVTTGGRASASRGCWTSRSSGY